MTIELLTIIATTAVTSGLLTGLVQLILQHRLTQELRGYEHQLSRRLAEVQGDVSAHVGRRGEFNRRRLDAVVDLYGRLVAADHAVARVHSRIDTFPKLVAHGKMDAEEARTEIEREHHDAVERSREYTRAVAAAAIFFDPAMLGKLDDASNDLGLQLVHLYFWYRESKPVPESFVQAREFGAKNLLREIREQLHELAGGAGTSIVRQEG